MYRKMKEYAKKRLDIYRKKDTEFFGRIGDLANNVVNVPGKSWTIYVTLQSGVVVEAINNRIPSYFNTPVVVGYIADDRPNIMQVLRKWVAYGGAETPADGIAFHRNQHEWPGADTIYVSENQFTPSLVYPIAGSLSVYVYPGHYYTKTGWKTVKALTTVNLTSSVPGSADQARYANIVVDDTGAFVVRNGSIITGYSNLADTDIPKHVFGDNDIAAVKLFYGQTEFRKDNNNNDFVDLRFRTYAEPKSTVTIKSSTYTLVSSDEVVVFTATATANLPAATGSGQTYRIICRAGTCTVDGSGSETIKGATTQTLYPGEDLIITDVQSGMYE